MILHLMGNMFFLEPHEMIFIPVQDFPNEICFKNYTKYLLKEAAL